MVLVVYLPSWSLDWGLIESEGATLPLSHVLTARWVEQEAFSVTLARLEFAGTSALGNWCATSTTSTDHTQQPPSTNHDGLVQRG